MALTFDQAYIILQRDGRSIGQLVKRGDKMARDVYDRYRDWYTHEHRAYMAGMAHQDTRRRRAVVSALEQYLQRELDARERERLAGSKGHLVETDVAVPANIIQLSVQRALRDRR